MTREDSPFVVEVSGLVKDYQGLRPLRVRDLRVRPGERVAISGLDAVAAEVFVNLLNGAILPDEGDVRVFGRLTRDVQDEAEWFALLDRLGIVTARAVLLEGSSVRQNLALPFTLEIDALSDDVDRRLTSLASAVDLPSEILDRPAGGVAAHARMRIHLARALALSPSLLLLEHPTGAMDRDDVPAFAETLREVAVARGLALVAVTEDTLFAERVAGTVLALRGGTGSLVSSRGWRRWW